MGPEVIKLVNSNSFIWRVHNSVAMVVLKNVSRFSEHII